MISSGKKRGLSIAAVSALAVVGLPLAASAQTVGESGTALTLYSQYSGGASTDSTGTNATVTLLAGFPTSIGPDLVNSVRFSYDGGVIATVVPETGVATTEWAAPAGTWTITVQALDNGGNVLDTDTRAAVVSNAANPSIEFGNAMFANVGQWGGEIVVRGTVAGGGDNALLSAQGPEATTAETAGVLTASGVGLNNFVGVVTLGANNTADATDQVVVGARTEHLAPGSGVSDDTSVVTVYNQTVASVVKTLNAGSNVLQADGSAADTKWTLKALDQNGNIIQGLDIYEANAAGGATPGNCGTPDLGATNTAGEFGVTLNEATIDNGACDPGAADNKQTTYYVADVNEDGNYLNGTDYLFDFTQTQYAPTATTVEISNALGNVMDDNETSPVTFLVKDQNGNPMPNAVVRYKVDRTGHTPTADAPAIYADAPATGADGKTTIPLAAHPTETEVVTVSAYVNKDGDPTPTAADAIATPFVINTDTTEVLWDSGVSVQFPANTTQTSTGKLVQVNTDKAMPNRPLDIDYADGDTPLANSILAPQAQQPAGTLRGSNYEAQVTTSATGTFGVAALDPATPVGQELNAEFRVSSDALPNNLDAENDPQVLDVDWLRNLTPARVVVYNGDADTQADGLENWFFGGSDIEPGQGGVGYVRAFNADGVELTDVQVRLTIDQGHFVDQKNVYQNPTPGAPVDLTDAGKTLTVSTGDSGEGFFLANIERNAGFDDNGLVSDRISAAVGSATDQHDLVWNTIGTPLNPRANDPLVVGLSAVQESTILPKARAGDTNESGQFVNYDVRSFDQFGNATLQDTTTTDNTPLADFISTGSSTFGLSQPAIRAFAAAAVDQVLEVELNGAVTWKFGDNPYDSTFNPATPGIFVQGTPDTREPTDAINWYVAEFSGFTFTFGQQGPETVPVGRTVTMVLDATDEFGNAVQGLEIDFFRAGPGAEDSDGNNRDFTNRNGEAFYDFAGGSPGVANVTAIAYSRNGNRLGRVGSDTVAFSRAAQPVRTSIVAKLFGHNTGSAADRLRVKAPAKAGGAVVRLFKVVNGNRVGVGTKKLNANGGAAFKIKDRNGRRFTKYVAVVQRTVDTKSDTTNPKRVR